MWSIENTVDGSLHFRAAGHSALRQYIRIETMTITRSDVVVHNPMHVMISEFPLLAFANKQQGEFSFVSASSSLLIADA